MSVWEGKYGKRTNTAKLITVLYEEKFMIDEEKLYQLFLELSEILDLFDKRSVEYTLRLLDSLDSLIDEDWDKDIFI